MFTKDISSNFEKNIKNEWLVTNGIGGYASSTLIGVNTRKYHGLLVASLGDNLNRMMILSKLNEFITLDGVKYSLSSNECNNYVEKGYIYEEAFERKFLPEFFYSVEGVGVTKKLAMVHKENKVCIKYQISNTNDVLVYFSVLPLVNYRSFHAVSNAREYPQTYDEEGLLSLSLDNNYSLFMKAPNSEYMEYKATFYSNMFYRVEKDRGFDANENLYIPGEFKIEVPAKSNIEFYVVAEFGRVSSITDEEIPSIIRSEEIRLEKVCKIASAKTDLEKDLVTASEQFIVSKGNYKSIVAGYPWFSDWGRDTFISFEGLLLKTNRFNHARDILRYFANYVRRGLVPNFIDENGGGSYNTADASLWFIDAAYKYYRYTSDYETIKEIFPKLLEIVYSYMVGTDFDIYMDDDGLISAGNSETQLTWMDAKVGDFIPTPRFGKTVEINALWYNALKIIQSFNDRLVKKYCSAEGFDYEDKSDIVKTIYGIANDKAEKVEDFNENKTRALFLADEVLKYYSDLSIVFDERLSKKVKASFKKFYNDDGLFDIIEPFSNQIRPNQIIALSLSFPVVQGEKAEDVLKLVADKLLTNKGLKTLSSDDKDYKPRYEGDSYSRDTSYHQGTVWVWLLGEYAKAYKNIYKKPANLKNVEELLTDGCIGSVAEIYDADEPRYAKGALAQAWSVAALITMKF